jgi:hypothetical protein
MHENVMMRHVCVSFFALLTPRPGTAVVDWTCKYGAFSSLPGALCAACGCGMVAATHPASYSMALTGSAKVERLRPRTCIKGRCEPRCEEQTLCEIHDTRDFGRPIVRVLAPIGYYYEPKHDSERGNGEEGGVPKEG